MSFQTLEAVATRTSVARVNLLPAEVGSARRGRLLQAGLALGLVGVLGVSAAAYAVTAGHVGTATEALEAEQQRTLQLQQAQRRYVEVPRVLAELETARRVQQDVTSGDVPAYELLDQLAAGAPQDLSLTNVSLDTTAATSTAASTGTPTDPLAVQGVGTLEVTGQTKTQAQVAAWMDQVAGIAGLADPRLSTSTLDPVQGVVTFNATATVTADALLSAR
ncbi:PilN domain-containing protein [Kineococcus indalonis]|uniref:PilN domain-containing protein n=1 Tax=Kineococcus indalonis TaxID=2696566 RepID=UPI0014126AB0|nr:PilN domain-containing protein [Kineococcus indalonis]NAZ84611.1 hypothetical protein [Kineococcus indalonis]